MRKCAHRVVRTRTGAGRREENRDDAKMRRVEVVKPPISYADLQRMPDDGNRYELYDGELWVVPAPLLLLTNTAAARRPLEIRRSLCKNIAEEPTWSYQ